MLRPWSGDSSRFQEHGAGEADRIFQARGFAGQLRDSVAVTQFHGGESRDFDPLELPTQFGHIDFGESKFHTATLPEASPGRNR